MLFYRQISTFFIGLICYRFIAVDFYSDAAV